MIGNQVEIQLSYLSIVKYILDAFIAKKLMLATFHNYQQIINIPYLLQDRCIVQGGVGLFGVLRFEQLVIYFNHLRSLCAMSNSVGRGT